MTCKGFIRDPFCYDLGNVLMQCEMDVVNIIYYPGNATKITDIIIIEDVK